MEKVETTTPPWVMLTPTQVKEGWFEFRGVTPVHHEFIVIEKIDDQHWKCRNPALWLLEHPS